MLAVLVFFLVAIIVLAMVVSIIVALRSHGQSNNMDIMEENKDFFDKKGNHVYYDRSIIEKEEFIRQHPYGKPLRTFKRLFSRKS